MTPAEMCRLLVKAKPEMALPVEYQAMLDMAGITADGEGLGHLYGASLDQMLAALIADHWTERLPDTHAIARAYKEWFVLAIDDERDWRLHRLFVANGAPTRLEALYQFHVSRKD